MSPEQAIGGWSTSGRTSSRSARSSTRWRPADERSSVPRRPRRWRRSSRRSLNENATFNSRSGSAALDIERCLTRSPGDFASTEDLASDLVTLRDHLSEATRAIIPRCRTSPRREGAAEAPAAIAAAIFSRSESSAGDFRSATFWKNPIAGARYSSVHRLGGLGTDAAVSADGKFVAFVRPDGTFDAWLGQVGRGEFLNLSKGREPGLCTVDLNRGVGFSDDGAHVGSGISPEGRSAEQTGGATECLIGSNDRWNASSLSARCRRGGMVARPHTDRVLRVSPGDPIFIADRNGANPRQIFNDKPGMHNHYVTWSPDGRYIYFVRGLPAEPIRWTCGGFLGGR